MMKKMSCLFVSLILIGSFLNAQDSSDTWVGEWIKGIEFAKDQRCYSKALEAYTGALRALKPNQETVKLHLVNERGNLYFNMFDFKSAVKDFSYVLNASNVNQEQIIEALWGRSKAYLASGKFQEFEQDNHQLDRLQTFITALVQTRDYDILNVNPYILRDSKSEERFVKLLLMRKEIKSEKDVTFTPSGLVIVKKIKAAPS